MIIRGKADQPTVHLTRSHMVRAIPSVTLFDKLNIFLGCLLPPPVTQACLGMNMASVRSSGVFFLVVSPVSINPKMPWHGCQANPGRKIENNNGVKRRSFYADNRPALLGWAAPEKSRQAVHKRLHAGARRRPPLSCRGRGDPLYTGWLGLFLTPLAEAPAFDASSGNSTSMIQTSGNA
jgi:hypothetical protein